MTVFTVLHDAHDGQTVISASDLPRDRIAVEQEVEELVNRGFHR
jgi:archaeosine-15-forming tRNA-guanine transglycosylase